ncbi:MULTISPECIES: hypothetical protein [Mycobacterium]|uniref:DUF732 domain-containing protein n=1 Tax=Mycobacterium kiyosense TaxID=2871094 RepID=A0A9P3UX27_9MYCO|nr:MULTISPECIES: hypothetical protein [Mycobacterium]BDB41290.1 hypothetical protein IWGMT90018_17360 [Mycobacterium kiyosense]BDE13045.1 hypothetical protein MKCMC460_19050 [Mycobacterium sp. 20KCMC460]GLB82003.1 hypothetical protein SRL2020028_12590 [Mycobacterium kiyosense]GLB89514.1 hypothetical protein SRL2020130_23310 [Mycobacterium kiyosense]GLB95145.1 hypothetical protein SRL2020226_19210 [Mycobacterium kiyosense]
MSLRIFIAGLGAGLIGGAAVFCGAGVASADPDDTAPPLIEDFLTVISPGLAQDYRSTDTPNNFGVPNAKDWTGSGMYCQNRNAKCQKMGF